MTSTTDRQEAPAQVPPEYIHLTLEELFPITKMKRTAIYGAIKTDGFPAPIQFGPKRSVWNLASVLSWIESRPRGVRPVRKGA